MCHTNIGFGTTADDQLPHNEHNMISNADHPVEWAMLVTELDDAREHLESLIDEMAASGAIDEIDYAVQLGHVCAHLYQPVETSAI